MSLLGHQMLRVTTSRRNGTPAVSREAERLKERLRARLSVWVIGSPKGAYRSILTMEQYRLVDVKRKAVVLGERYEASFEAVEQYLNKHTSGTGRKGP